MCVRVHVCVTGVRVFCGAELTQDKYRVSERLTTCANIIHVVYIMVTCASDILRGFNLTFRYDIRVQIAI